MRDPQSTALIDGDRRRTFAELDERSTRLAHAFRRLGLNDEGRVAIMLPNSIELFECSMASAKCRVPYVPVNWHLKAEELAYVLEDSGAQVLVSTAELGDHVARAAAAVPGCQVITVGGDYEEQLAAAGETPEPIENGWATPAYVFYTSGTTGRPKGVVHASLDPERMGVAQQGLIAMWGFVPEDVHILSGPAYHAGPGGYAHTSLFNGNAVVVLRDWDARAWLRLVDEHRVSTSFMTPAHFIRILEVPDEERAGYDLSSLRLIIHGGAPCPVPVKHRIIEALAPGEIWELYGASEGGATRISPKEWLERPGSVGVPWPGVEVRILEDESGRQLGPNETGVIYIRPAAGAQFHYHGDQAKTDEAWRDGAFTVGDMGHVDEDGYLFITDRKSDMVLRGGVNVYPREVEDVLHRHPDVIDCAVFGIPDERLGERLKAMVEVRGPLTADDLREFVRQQLADFKVPSDWELVDELPRDPNGKVLKRLLKDAHRNA